MLQQIAPFITYFSSIRQRTLTFIHTIPASQFDWSPQPGEFTCGDIVRHLAAAEQMFVGAVVTEKWHYAGHDHTTHPNKAAAIAYLETSHATAMTRLRTLSDTALHQPVPSLDGPPVKSWRLLMALVEHEIHHRSQLAMYLTLLGITPPHLYGMGVEDVIARATG